jgi:hypothetical protein
MAEASHGSGRLRERFENVRGRIEAAAQRSNRSAKEISLVAISKTHSTDTLRVALELGIEDFGENRVQEAEGKIMELGRRAARWHLVGHLQANKARRAVNLFDVIHSLDSVALTRRLDHLCVEEGIATLPVLIQVDLAGEETKTGLAENELPSLINVVKQCSRLNLIGLMTLPPFFKDAEQVRPFFKRLRQLRDELREQDRFDGQPGELSMGMSNDFEVAIEEGATILRIGTAIFGERN